MIFIMSQKSLLDNIKKIAKSAEYTIINGTKSSKVRNLRTGDGVFNCLIPSAVLLEEHDGSWGYDKKLKSFLKANALKETFAIIAVSVVEEPETNVLVVLKNKVYKKLGKKIFNRMLKTYGIDEDENNLVFMYDDTEVMRDTLEQAYSGKLAKIDKEILKENNSKRVRELRDKRAHIAAMCDGGSDARKQLMRLKVSKKNLKQLKVFLKGYESYHKTVIQDN